MTGLPKLPGFSFADPTQTRHHLSQTLGLANGYKIPKSKYMAIGGRELLVNSVTYLNKQEPVRFDPSLIYGRTKSVALPRFLPHYALYDQKCLTFKAFFKQSVVESQVEHYRVRQVNIIYFLEDDTITVMEPRTPNSGIDQGRLIRRGKIPKHETGDLNYHWKDLNVGKDIAFYGTVFHTVECDVFTKEYMASQGILINDAEEMPFDPYTQERLMQVRTLISKTPPADDKLRRFLEYDGKILKFDAVWDDRDSDYGEMRKYNVLYFLSEDTISVKELHEKNDGRDPFPVLLRKTKLPKIYTDRPITFPSIYFELSDTEVSEYYQPKDLRVGETIFVLGRKMLLYDCDKFTRDYYKKALCITQSGPVDVALKQKPKLIKPIPPHDGIGSLDDSLQNTISFLPKPPRKDVVRQILNANKYLRYEMVMDTVHPEDTIRKFLLLYSLADSTCKIHEPIIRNSGILGGKYLRSTLLTKPGSDPLNPDFYSPSDFSVGAVIAVFEQRFRIVGADLYVYRYMQANPNKFPCEVIENMRNYMFNKGYLQEDVEDQLKKNLEQETKRQRDSIGRELEYRQTDMAKCLEGLNVGDGDCGAAATKRADILQQYEDSLQHRYKLPPYGIQPVNTKCVYQVHVGDVKSSECQEEAIAGGSYNSYTPRHIETEQEKVNKYYSDVLKRQQEVCKDGGPRMECAEPAAGDGVVENGEDDVDRLLMVNAPDRAPEEACRVKNVRFADVADRCARKAEDLCNLKGEITNCDCLDYPPDCE